MNPKHRIVTTAAVLALAWTSLSTAAETLKVTRSENAGRSGRYTASTPIEGCKFHVYVPKSYTASNPAGIHLFLDGQGTCAKNEDFRRWSKHFLEPHNLIGINMQYLDGNNARDIPGKLAAAQFAVAQVQLDYKIIPGRGVISSFSGGGVIHGRYWKAFSDQKTPDQAWPFLHHALYSSNWFVDTKSEAPVSWFLAAGDRSKDNVWVTMMGVMHRLQQLGQADVLLRVTPGKPHIATGDDAAASAEIFARTDLLFAPFLYEPDWPGESLKAIVRQAHARRFQSALDELAQQERNQVTRGLRQRIEARIAALVALAGELLERDAVLADRHLPTILVQLEGHPAHWEIKKRFEQTSAAASHREILKLQETFTAQFRELMDPKTGKPVPAYMPLLKSCVESAGEQSLLGRMAGAFLACE